MIRSNLFPAFLATLTAFGLGACQSAPAPAPEASEEEASGIVVFGAEERGVVTLATGSVALRDFETTREAPGQISARPESESVVHAPLAGHLVKVHAKIGDRLDAGAPLATLSSAALGSAQAAYLKAKGEADLARRDRDRLRGLSEADLASKQEVEAVNQRDASAQLALSQAREELRVLGLDDAAINGLKRIDPQVVLRAPMPGTVVDRHAAVGQYVVPESADPLFELMDLRTVRVQADLPERDFLAVRAGLAADVKLAALPGRPFAGKVVALSPTVDPASRTGQALIELANPQGLLKPGMAVSTAIRLTRPDVLVVPAAALQREADRAFVYVPRGEDRFEEIAVKLGEVGKDYVELKSGPEAGTTVVTTGSFDLRSEARKELFGGEH